MHPRLSGRKRRCLLTFHTTTGAMAMEKHCQERQLPGRLIPVPREISAGCGMAWMADPQDRESLLAMIRELHLDLDGVYEITR